MPQAPRPHITCTGAASLLRARLQGLHRPSTPVGAAKLTLLEIAAFRRVSAAHTKADADIAADIRCYLVANTNSHLPDLA